MKGDTQILVRVLGGRHVIRRVIASLRDGFEDGLAARNVSTIDYGYDIMLRRCIDKQKMVVGYFKFIIAFLSNRIVIFGTFEIICSR
jgi:hypothetical protein